MTEPRVPVELYEVALQLRRLAEGLREDSAEDAVQEAWVDLLQRKARPSHHPLAWMRQMVRRHFFRQLRRERRRKRVETALPPRASGRSAFEVAEDAELRRILGEELSRLPVEAREMLRLRYVEGLGIASIAQRLGVSVETVRSRRRRALERMRQRLVGRLDQEASPHLDGPDRRGRRTESGRVLSPSPFVALLAGGLLRVTRLLLAFPPDASSSMRSHQGSRRFVIRWTLWSALGLGLGLPLGLLASGPLELVVAMVLVTPLMFLVTGLVVAVAQWCALQQRPAARRWIPASAVGLAVGLTAGTVLVEVVGEAITGQPLRLHGAPALQLVLAFAVIGGAAGAAMGCGQWWSLRGRSGAVRARWILECTLAFVAAFWISLGLMEWAAGGVTSGRGGIGFLGVASVLVGLFSGRAYVRSLV